MARIAQKARILSHLKNGHSLTQGEALKLFGSSRLASRIDELRKEGVEIVTDMIEVDCADGHTATVARYRIPQKMAEMLF